MIVTKCCLVINLKYIDEHRFINESNKKATRQHGFQLILLKMEKKVNLVFLKEVFFDASNDRPS